MNGHSSPGGPRVHVLYKITNSKGDEGAYNAFELPSGINLARGGVSLSTVKNHCHALNRLNRAGASGYHWRVRVDDKVSNPKARPKYSWWDIQDDAARLPVKEVGIIELQNMLSTTSAPKAKVEDSSPSTKNMVRQLGKAMNKVAATVEGTSSTQYDNGPRVPIVMFKLVDVVKLQDSYGYGGHEHVPVSSSSNRRNVNVSTPAAPVQNQTPQRRATPPTASNAQTHQHQPRRQPSPGHPAPSSSNNTAAEGSLMDFGPGPSKPSLSHSAPASFGASNGAPSPAANETRAQKLKREYAKKNKSDNRVWDEVDQRWVTVEAKNGEPVKRGTTSAPPGSSSTNNATASLSKKIQGISLDEMNTAGKSVEVAAAVQSRVNEMRESQKKAVTEIREREEAKKTAEAEEDLVRQQLEPKIKAWSEEHGKKKQLRALLASLHTILWPDAKWKPVNLGDLLDDRKCKLSYHKASRVVHPDKTIHLPAEQRFLAKRIFDALSQAKTEFDK